ncbi:PAS domain-containing sensor histidine kinase [Pelotalea chapellei]|uniref:histidine kinase n=1 Tax=Pelotalea chapellei TaxID=44671 RepID=A0ABS5U4F9_9BACT|nr:PAS domain-containing sensor histidine kinase [Pelotalea chapellei]MBT1070538.1 response regulator [Pelotalea chapellei]
MQINTTNSIKELQLRLAELETRNKELQQSKDATEILLQKSTERNQLNLQIIACAQEGIIVYGPDLRYLVWNPYMERITGAPASDILGRHPLEVFPHLRDNGVIDMLEKVLAGDTIKPDMHPFHVPKNELTSWGAFSRAPLRDAQGEIVGVIVTVRDITGYKRSEEAREKLQSQLYQAQKMEAVGHLAGGIAHDFNNILTVINGYCALLKMDMDKNLPETPLVWEIAEAASRATHLTHSLLAFSRKQIMRIQDINLNLVVTNVEKMLRRVIGEDIELQITIGSDPLHVKVDHLQIEQVLLNLATNARDAMPRGGKLHIKTEYKELDEASIKNIYPVIAGNYAILSVSDSGSGIPNDIQEKIFEPFFTTKEAGVGTGLGLSMVYGIVKQHGGYIYVYSSPGEGATFRIYLPAVMGTHEALKEGAVQELPPSGNVTILVAEDEEPIRKLMKAILDKFGYKVILAVDGQDAVEKFRENQEEIKLVLMDVIMPRKNGKEASSEIAGIKKNTKFLFISGYGADIIRSRGDLEEDAELIMKPAEPGELLKKIKEMLDR